MDAYALPAPPGDSWGKWMEKGGKEEINCSRAAQLIIISSRIQPFASHWSLILLISHGPAGLRGEAAQIKRYQQNADSNSFYVGRVGERCGGWCWPQTLHEWWPFLFISLPRARAPPQLSDVLVWMSKREKANVSFKFDHRKLGRSFVIFGRFDAYPDSLNC